MASSSCLDAIVENIARRSGLSAHEIRYGMSFRAMDARHAAYFCAAQRGLSGVETAAYFGTDRQSVRRGLERMESLLAAVVSEGAQ